MSKSSETPNKPEKPQQSDKKDEAKKDEAKKAGHDQAPTPTTPTELPPMDERRLSLPELRELKSLLNLDEMEPWFSDGSANVRANAATACAVLEEASPALLILLRDSDLRVAEAAAKSVDHLRSKFADQLQSVVLALSGASGEVTGELVKTLGKFIGRQNDEVIAALNVGEALAVKTVIAACELAGGSGIDLLLQGSANKNDRIRANSVVGLELLTGSKHSSRVIDRLNQIREADTTPDVRQAAKRAIITIEERLTEEGSDVLDLLPKHIPEFEERALSLSELKEHVGSVSVSQIISALEDGRKHVRINGARLLAAKGAEGREAAGDLGRLLRDTVSQVRREAARAFAKLGDAVVDAADALVSACGDDSVEVAEAAADALRAQGAKVEDALVRGLDAGEEAHGRRVAQLVSELPRSVELLCTAFRSPATNVQVNAARGLALLGPKRAGQGIALLEGARTGGDSRTRAAVQEAMAILAPPQAGPPPIHFKGFEDRYLTIEELGKSAERMRIDSLMQSISDGRPEVRANSATALQILGDRAAETIPLLAARTRDDTAQVRIAALDALGAMGPLMLQAADAIVGALGDDNDKVVDTASKLATACGAKMIPALVRGLETDDRRHGENIIKLIHSFPDAVDILSDAFDSPAVNVQVNAALGLGMLGPERIGRGRRLLEGARTGGWVRTREAVFEALEMLTPPDNAPPPITVAGFDTTLLGADAFDATKLNLASILAAATDGRPVVRANACTALGVLGDASPEVLRLLGAFMRDSAKEVRVGVARAAGKLGEKSLELAPDLVKALGDSEEDVVAAVSSVLAQHKARVVGALLRGLETDDEAHADNIVSLLLALPDAVDILCDCIDSPSVNVKVNAARGLGRLGPKAAGAGRTALEGKRTGGDVRTREAVFKALAMLDSR